MLGHPYLGLDAGIRHTSRHINKQRRQADFVQSLTHSFH